MTCLCEEAQIAYEAGDEHALRDAVAASVQFLDEHLLRWLPLFADDVAKGGDAALYPAMADLLRRFAEADRTIFTTLA